MKIEEGRWNFNHSELRLVKHLVYVWPEKHLHNSLLSAVHNCEWSLVLVPAACPCVRSWLSVESVLFERV